MIISSSKDKLYKRKLNQDVDMSQSKALIFEIIKDFAEPVFGRKISLFK